MTRTRNSNYKGIVAGFVAGIIGGIFTWLATDFISVKQNLVLLSSVSIDSNDTRQGNSALRWDFRLQPAKKYLFSPAHTIGGLLHLRIRPDNDGHISELDLLKYKEIRFFAKASSEIFILNEINLFTGPDFIQYRYSNNETFLLSTKWAEYHISLNKFAIAPWELKYRSHLIDKNFLGEPNLRKVSSLGFDLKTEADALSGRIWIDYLRLVNKEGNEEILADGNSLNVKVQGHPMVWLAGAQQY